MLPFVTINVRRKSEANYYKYHKVSQSITYITNHKSKKVKMVRRKKIATEKTEEVMVKEKKVGKKEEKVVKARKEEKRREDDGDADGSDSDKSIDDAGDSLVLKRLPAGNTCEGKVSFMLIFFPSPLISTSMIDGTSVYH